MKIFVTGGSGLLGSRVAEMAEGHEILATYNKNRADVDFPLVPLDITKKEEVDSTLSDFNPDAVIHTAALTNVDYCEDHREEAMRINEGGTRNLAGACEKIGARLIYVSTDFVFDGKKGLYTEEDKAHPISHYGTSKLLGEEASKECSNYAIARVSVLYGQATHTRGNFVTWVRGALKRGEKINIVTDQYTSPTYVNNAAGALFAIFEKDKKGIFHTSGGERINRFYFAKKIADVFSLDETLINPITSEGLIQKAKRPNDSSLSVKKTERELKIKMLKIEEGLKMMRDSK